MDGQTNDALQRAGGVSGAAGNRAAPTACSTSYRSWPFQQSRRAQLALPAWLLFLHPGRRIAPLDTTTATLRTSTPMFLTLSMRPRTLTFAVFSFLPAIDTTSCFLFVLRRTLVPLGSLTVSDWIAGHLAGTTRLDPNFAAFGFLLLFV